MPALTHPRVLRPSWRQYRAWFRGGLGLAALGVLAALVSYRRTDERWVWALAMGAVILIAALCLLYVAVVIATTSIVLDGGRITCRSLGRTRVLVVDDGLVGLLAGYAVAVRGVRRTVDILVIRAPGDSRRVRINGGYFTRADLLETARYAGEGVEVHDAAYSAAEFHRIVPGTSTWAERHQVAIGVSLGVGVVVAVTGGVFGYFIVAGRPPFDTRPPRGVAEATIQTQDELLTALTAELEAAGGEWEIDDAAIAECNDPDQYKGWRRTVEAHPVEGVEAPPASRPLLERLADQMTAVGLDDIHANGYTGDVYLYAIPAGVESRSGAPEVTVTLEGESSEVQVTSACEH